MKKLLNNKKACKFLLAVYILALVYFVILKLYMPFEYILISRQHILESRVQGYYNVNFIPFRSIISYFNPSIGINYWNILGNTIPFVILGILSAAAGKENVKLMKVWIADMILILCFEVFQFIVCVGTFDVDDIILNGISCFIGLYLFDKLDKKRKEYGRRDVRRKYSR